MHSREQFTDRWGMATLSIHSDDGSVVSFFICCGVYVGITVAVSIFFFSYSQVAKKCCPGKSNGPEERYVASQ